MSQKKQPKTLDQCTRQILIDYFSRLDDCSQANNLHQSILEQVEKPLLEEVLIASQGNQLKAAKMLGINRNTLYKKIKYFNLK